MTTNWTTKKLRDLLEIQNGYAFDSKKFDTARGVPLIRIRDLKAGVSTEARYHGEFDQRYIVQAGDLLIGMDGEFGCYEWRGEHALLNQRVCRLQGFSTALLPRFLLYGINSHLKKIEEFTTFTTVKHLSSKQILDVDFPTPPLFEQQRIVAILDEAFEAIATAKANTEKNLQNARSLFETYLEASVTAPAAAGAPRRLDEVCGITSSLIDPRVAPFLHDLHVGAGNIETGTGYLSNLQTAEEEGLISGKFPFDETMVLYSKIRPYLRKVARPEFSGLCSADIYPLAPDHPSVLS